MDNYIISFYGPDNEAMAEKVAALIRAPAAERPEELRPAVAPAEACLVIKHKTQQISDVAFGAPGNSGVPERIAWLTSDLLEKDAGNRIQFMIGGMGRLRVVFADGGTIREARAAIEAELKAAAAK